MNHIFNKEWREQVENLLGRLRSSVEPVRAKVVEWFQDISIKDAISARMRGVFTTDRPVLEITSIRPSTLIVLMVGASVQQYEQSGQLGRLSSALDRHAKYFRSVVLMTTDRSDYTSSFDSDRVSHVQLPRLLSPTPFGGIALLMSAFLRFRMIRKATSVVIVDEQSAPTGWMVSRLSGSCLSMSVGAPWGPPQDMNTEGMRRWVVRAAIRRVEQIVQWPNVDVQPSTDERAVLALPNLVDADLFCPLTTTDPARPRTVGVFLGAENEADARVILGVSGRLARRNQSVVIRVFVSGHEAESRASAMQAEVAEQDLSIEFQTLPRVEMRPDAIARLRMCIAFNDAESIQNLLQAMASGVPGIAVAPAAADEEVDKPGWSRFVLFSSPTEEEISRNIETLFREPGVRLRMAREGRRFVIANHSLEALATRESKLLLGPDHLDNSDFIPEDEFDSDAEAEKLAQMLEMVGVMRTDSENDDGGETAA